MPKTLRLSIAFCIGLFVLFGLMVTAPSHAAVGRTQGNFNVSSTGSASYTIPIFTPPGPNGIQPSVALVYSSNSGFGYLGKGWSLAGFSSISRCNSTIAQDGNARDVYLWDQDALCLDGNRLRVQSGTYGQGGSNVVYATEVADFSRITSTGSGNSGSAPAYRGPQYWTVERKDGLIYTYGGTADSRIVPNSSLDAVSQWMLSEIRDRNGNKVRFTWKTPDSTTVRMSHPTKIEWTRTSSSSSTYVYSMDFNYTAGGNAAASTYSGYLAQYPRKDSDLLTSISVSVSGTVVRKYELTYETSTSTGSQRLAQVKECTDSAGSDCLSPTTFAYQESTPGYNVSSPALSVSGNIIFVDGRHDFNGDGIKDIAYYKSLTVYVRFGSSTGNYSSEYSTGQGNMTAGKLLGNGADQFLGGGNPNWLAYYWNGSYFSTADTGVAYSSTTDGSWNNV